MTWEQFYEQVPDYLCKLFGFEKVEGKAEYTKGNADLLGMKGIPSEQQTGNPYGSDTSGIRAVIDDVPVSHAGKPEENE